METISYAVVDSYTKTLPRVRAALANTGLEIAGEWDVAYDLRADYGVSLAPCRILTVYDPIKLLQNMVMDASAALTGQVSVAVCEGGGHARIFVRGSRSRLRDQVENALQLCGARHLAPVSAA
jgi:uncharacterized protein (DUF302 family)